MNFDLLVFPSDDDEASNAFNIDESLEPSFEADYGSLDDFGHLEDLEDLDDMHHEQSNDQVQANPEDSADRGHDNAHRQIRML